MDSCNDPLLSQMLQCFIYTLNDPEIRQTIIHHYIKLFKLQDIYQYLGTWFITEQDDTKQFIIRQQVKQLQYKKDIDLDKFIKLNITKLSNQEKISIFTVCLIYEGNRVHFVSFTYHPNLKKIYNFDSGYVVYPKGQIINKMVRKFFHKHDLITYSHIQSIQNIGKCSEYTFCGNEQRGVQYNGDHDSILPADAFCQTWSEWYLIREIMQNILKSNLNKNQQKKYDCVKNWCKMFPSEREFIIITSCIIPWLTFIPKVQTLYLEHLHSIDEFKYFTISEVLAHLFHYTEECFFAKFDGDDSQIFC